MRATREFLFALADAIAPEYRAVVDAGFILQIDDPGLPDWWDMLRPAPSIDAYRKFAQLRIDAVNRALAGIPEDKVRYHLCWGSWHGPHTHDLPLEHIVDLVLQVKARSYSFEAGNVRHEHEWRVWKDAGVPKGKILMPGVVSHATNLVEHPISSPTVSCAMPTSSAARTSSPAAIAASATASIPRSSGPSSPAWPKARGARARCCGGERITLDVIRIA